MSIISFILIQADALQAELDQSRERVEELTLDLDLMRAEMENASHTDSGGISNIQVKQLEEQNKRLKDTLVR